VELAAPLPAADRDCGGDERGGDAEADSDDAKVLHAG
jgi:hypothetical protein